MNTDQPSLCLSAFICFYRRPDSSGPGNGIPVGGSGDFFDRSWRRRVGGGVVRKGQDHRGKVVVEALDLLRAGTGGRQHTYQLAASEAQVGGPPFGGCKIAGEVAGLQSQALS